MNEYMNPRRIVAKISGVTMLISDEQVTEAVDAWLDEHPDVVRPTEAQVTEAVNAWLDAHPEATTTVQDGAITEQKLDPYLKAKVNGGGISNGVKVALLALLDRVYYEDENGPVYLDELRTALYPPANLVSISAAFDQGDNVIYDTDSLDTLKQYLTVTAHMDDGSTQSVSNYTLSGTLTEGTSTITVSYGGKTATFDVTATKMPNGFADGVYKANNETTATATVSNNKVAWAGITGGNRDFKIPLQRPVQLHAGDKLKITSTNASPDSANTRNIPVNPNYPSGLGWTNLGAFRATTASATWSVSADVVLTSVTFELSTWGNGWELGISMAINDEVVF